MTFKSKPKGLSYEFSARPGRSCRFWQLLFGITFINLLLISWAYVFLPARTLILPAIVGGLFFFYGLSKLEEAAARCRDDEVHTMENEDVSA